MHSISQIFDWDNKCFFKLWFFTVAMMTLCLLVGCNPLSEKQITGHYIRSNSGVSDSILIDTNGAFKQDVTFTNGSNWSINGSWKIINQVIQLDKCYLTFDDEKQTAIIPPQIVYMCTFSFEDGKLVRTELQPPWIKASETK